MGNLGSCCRLCLLSTDDQRVSIQDDEIFKKQFAKVFQYEIFDANEPSTHPKSVCQECYSKVTNFFTFYDSVLNCRDRFKEMAGKDANTIKSSLIEHEKTSLKRKLESDFDEHGRKKIKVSENPDEIIKREFKLVCDRCTGLNFDTFEALCAHFKETHDLDGFVLCCNERFMKKELAIDHAEWHLNQNLFKCFYCPARYSKRESLRNHELTCEKMDHKRQFKCKECPKTFFTDQEVKEHEKSHANAPKCKFCKRTFRHVDQLEAHMVNHPGKRLYDCSHCSFGCNFKAKMQYHELQKHKFENIALCIEKNDTFSDEQVAAHMNMDCELCPDTQFNKHQQLMEHFQNVHKEIGYIKCCNYKFYCKTTMNDHVEYHLKPDKFQCQGCQKNCIFGADLRRHIIECDKIVNKKKCPKCHTHFLEDEKYDEHVANAHSRDLLKCSKCNYNIAKMSKLKEHVLTAHEGKKLRYRCSKCEFSATNYKNFLHHMERSHQTDEKVAEGNEDEDMED